MAIAVAGSTIELAELPNSPRMRIQDGERVLERDLILHMENVGANENFTVIDQLISEIFPVGQLSGRYPGVNSLFFVDSANITPADESQKEVAAIGVNAYSAWNINITYKALKVEILPPSNPTGPPDPFELLEVNEVGTGEYTILESDRMFWENEQLPALDSALPRAVRIPHVNYEVIRHHAVINTARRTKIRDAVGRINKSAFPDTHKLFPGIPAEMLLFENYSIRNKLSSNGTLDKSLVYNFRERMGGDLYGGFNHLFDSKTGLFRKLSTKAFGAGQTDDTFSYEVIVNTKFDELFTT
jgi:hypothetical protein